MPYSRQWKLVNREGDNEKMASTMRLKVHGGWIVRTYDEKFGYYLSTAMCFMPDPEHVWYVKDEDDAIGEE